MPRLPLPVRWIVRWLLPSDERRVLMSELEELYRLRLESDGERAARRWLRREGWRWALRLLAGRGRAAGLGRESATHTATAPHPASATHAASAMQTAGARQTPGATMTHPLEAVRALTTELRLAVRGLLRTPAFTATVVLTVALAVGGTTAVFSVVHGVLIQPLPYTDPDQLVIVRTDKQGDTWGFSVADYVALEEQQTHFQAVALINRGTRTLTLDGSAERVPILRMTPSLLPLLGVSPALGRGFTDAEGQPDGPIAAILSHGFWTRRMGADPRAIERTVRLDGTEVSVVGVLPPDVGPFVHGPEVFLPLQVAPPPRKGPFAYIAFGRLTDGADRQAAAQELRAINDRIFPIWQDSWPDRASSWAMFDLKEWVVGDVEETLYLLLGAVVFLLLIASTNAANLLVARGLQRRRELAVRVALGASRPRIFRHVLAESTLLAVAGAALGLALALWGTRMGVAAAADFIPRNNEIGFTAPVLLFMGGITAGALLLFGLMPGVQATRTDTGQDLRSGGARSTVSGSASRLRRALVTAQFAVAVPLLVGAALLLTSLAKLQRVDPGYDPSRLLTVQLSLPGEEYETRAAVTQFWDDLIRQVAELPEVESAAVANGRPPTDYDFGNNFVLEDVPLAPDQTQPSVPWLIAGASYFETLGVPLLSGRGFEPADDSLDVALVDRAFERRFFPAGSAVGRRFRSGGCTVEGCPWWTIVGVVDDVKYEGLDLAGEGTIHVKFGRWLSSTAFLLVQTRVEPIAVLPAVRRIVTALNPGIPVSRVATGEELVGDSLREPRYLSVLVTAFAALAGLLSVVGIYGVMAYHVQQHRRDIGIRIALGGAPRAVARLVLGNGMRLVGAGVALGLLGALALTRFLASLLFEVPATDPATFLAVASATLAVAALACYLPAQRAARVDPGDTLRQE